MTAHSKLRAALVLVFFLALAYGTKALLDPYVWRFAGPISLTFVILCLTVYLRMAGESWRDLGLVALPGWKAKLMVLPKALLTAFAFAAVVAPILFIGPKLGLTFLETEPPGIEDRWADIEGNLGVLLLWLGIVWTSAAFFEEMFFRGFLITQIERIFGGGKGATFLAILGAAVIFGFGHYYYQGLRGFVLTGAIGFAFGVMFILFKRSLWPIILVHGIIDTISMIGLYYGLE